MSLKHHPTLEDNQCNPAGKYLTSFQRKSLQKSLQQNLADKQRQRIQIMLLADEEKTQAEICKELGCCQATARHWITMAKTNQAHHWGSNPIGRPNLVGEEYLQRLKQLVTTSPQAINIPSKDYRYPFKRWTAQKLSQHLQAELGIKVTSQHLNRLLKQMGLSTIPKPIPEVESDHPVGLDSNSCTIRDREGIQISNLDPDSMFDTSEIWNFNPLINN